MLLGNLQIDALTEVINIGVGRAAASLSELIKERIDLTVPHLEICALDELAQRMHRVSEPLDTSIVQEFCGGVSGRAMLCFPKQSGIKLAQVLAGYQEPTDQLDANLVGILEEVGNIVLNGVLGTIGNLIGNFVEEGLDYSVPKLHPDTLVMSIVADHLKDNQQDDCSVLLADAKFDVGGGRITGSLVIVFDLGCIETICNLLLKS